MGQKSRDSLQNKGKRDAFTFDPEDLVLVEDEKHPLYDERVHLPVNEGLVLNMMHDPDGSGVPQGCLQAIKGVRDTETGKVLVSVGRQRVKAAREANKRLKKAGLEPFWISVLMDSASKMTPARSMGMIISENEGHQYDSPLGRAKKMQRYIDIGRDEAELATLFHMSAASVKNHLSLLEAPADVRKAVEAGKISTSDAYRLAKLEPAEAKEKVAELIEHAPRTPGAKRSKNAKKAKEIVSGKKSNGSEEPKKISKKAEEAVANDVAAWIDENYEDLPADLIKGIRSGAWREIRGE